jgi:hypothetical protein
MNDLVVPVRFRYIADGVRSCAMGPLDTDEA